MVNGQEIRIELPTGGNNPTARRLRPHSDLVLEGIDFHHIIPQYQCYALGWLLQTIGDDTSMAVINKMYSGTAGNPTEPFARDSSPEAVRACAQRFRAALVFGFYGPSNRSDPAGQNAEPVRPDTYDDFKWQLIQRCGRKLRTMCPAIGSASGGQTVSLTVQETLVDEIKRDLALLVANAGTNKFSGYVHPFWPNDWIVDEQAGRGSYLLYFRPLKGRTKTAYPYLRGLAEALATPSDNEGWVNSAFADLIARAGGDQRRAEQIVSAARTTPQLSFRVRQPGDRMNFFWNKYVTPENDGRGLALLTPPVRPCVPFVEAGRSHFYAVV